MSVGIALEHVDLVELLGGPTMARAAVPVEAVDSQMHAS